MGDVVRQGRSRKSLRGRRDHESRGNRNDLPGRHELRGNVGDLTLGVGEFAERAPNLRQVMIGEEPDFVSNRLIALSALLEVEEGIDDERRVTGIDDVDDQRRRVRMLTEQQLELVGEEPRRNVGFDRMHPSRSKP